MGSADIGRGAFLAYKRPILKDEVPAAEFIVCLGGKFYFCRSKSNT